VYLNEKLQKMNPKKSIVEQVIKEGLKLKILGLKRQKMETINY
jgi:hypothetical protein